MFGHHRRPEYEEEVPVYPSEAGYGREGVSEDYGPSYARPLPPSEVVYEEGGGRVPYGRPEYAEGYDRPGYVRGEGEYVREGYGGGYGVPPPPPRVAYVEPYSSSEGSSDLGMGARDSGISDGPDYGAGYGGGYGQTAGYDGGRQEAEIERLQEELKTEKRHKLEAEAAAAAAVGYGIYEHHEKSQEEEATGQKKHHGFFGL